MNLNKSIRMITYVSLVSTVGYVGRIAFQFVPNVQPLTSIILLSTLTIGFHFGFSVAVISMLLSNLFLGMGPWTIAQITSYFLICTLTYLLRNLINRVPIIIQAFYAGLMGFLYGFIISFVQAPFLGIQTFWVYYVQGLSFDSFHAIGNICFYLFLSPTLTPLLLKIQKKI